MFSLPTSLHRYITTKLDCVSRFSSLVAQAELLLMSEKAINLMSKAIREQRSKWRVKWRAWHKWASKASWWKFWWRFFVPGPSPDCFALWLISHYFAHWLYSCWNAWEPSRRQLHSSICCDWGWGSHMKRPCMLVVLLKGINQGFWSLLECLWQNTTLTVGESSRVHLKK